MTDRKGMVTALFFLITSLIAPDFAGANDLPDIVMMDDRPEGASEEEEFSAEIHFPDEPGFEKAKVKVTPRAPKKAVDPAPAPKVAAPEPAPEVAEPSAEIDEAAKAFDAWVPVTEPEDFTEPSATPAAAVRAPATPEAPVTTLKKAPANLTASEADFAPLPEPEAPALAPGAPDLPALMQVELIELEEERGPFMPPRWTSTEVLGPMESPNGSEAYIPDPVPNFKVAPRSRLATQLPEKKNKIVKSGKKKKPVIAKKKKKRRPVPKPVEDEFSEDEYDREPADEDTGTRTFRDSIRGLIEFNGQWEVSFNGQDRRYRLIGPPDAVSDYQGSGQFVEVTVHEATRRILSVTPVKVRFRPIR